MRIYNSLGLPHRAPRKMPHHAARLYDELALEECCC